MLGSVWSRTIRDQRAALVWWAIGLAGACLLTTAFYPSVKENAASLERLLNSLPEGLRRAFGENFSSPAGYLQARLFSLLAPLLLIIYAIGAGARAIAGEEEHKTLDLLLATPVSRSRVLTEKALAAVAITAALGVVLWGVLAITGPAFEITVGVGRLAAAVADCFLLAAAFGGLALAVGAGTGRQGLAIGIASAVAAASYLIDILALSVGGLRWLQEFSLFFHYRTQEPLTNGLDPVHSLLLASVAVVGGVVAWFTFERRDLAA